MRLHSDAFLKSPETGKLFGNTSIPTLVDRLCLRPTRFSGRFVTAQRRSLVQKPRLELEYLLEPRRSGGFFPLSRQTVSALLQPKSQKACEICHSNWQVSVKPLG